MATICAKNIPKDRYEALRRQAKQNNRSIRAEFLEALEFHLRIYSGASSPSEPPKSKSRLRSKSRPSNH